MNDNGLGQEGKEKYEKGIQYINATILFANIFTTCVFMAFFLISKTVLEVAVL